MDDPILPTVRLTATIRNSGRVRAQALATIRALSLLVLILVLGACDRRHVSGRIEASDGRVGVPCVIERVDAQRQGGSLVLGTLQTRTGEHFSGNFVWTAGRTALHPANDRQEIMVRCDGYIAVSARTVSVERQWVGISLGTITVMPLVAKQRNR
jgi:hypothetical protein